MSSRNGGLPTVPSRSTEPKLLGFPLGIDPKTSLVSSLSECECPPSCLVSVIGPPTTHARQVRFAAHLKSNASQYPSSPAESIAAHSSARSSPVTPELMQSFISGVTINITQLPHSCFFAEVISTSHSSAIFPQYSSFGSEGLSGPYIAESMAVLRFLRLTTISLVAEGHAGAAFVSVSTTRILSIESNSTVNLLHL